VGVPSKSDNRLLILYSLDGKLWFSKPSDVRQFRERRAETL